MRIQKAQARLPCYLTSQPVKGPAMWALELDFSTDSVIEVDWQEQQGVGTVDFVQTLWIDNDQVGAGVLVVGVPGIPFHMNINAGVQIWVPIPTVVPCRIRFSTTPAANLVIPIIAFNVAIPNIQVF